MKTNIFIERKLNFTAMKKLILIFLIFINYTVSYSQQDFINWNTVGGNSNRDGISKDLFDFTIGFEKTFNAPNTIWGMPVFCNGNKFTTTRYTSLNPLRALIITFNFNSVNPVWTYGASSGVNVIMGFNDNVIYVRDFQQNGNDTIFALNAEDGSLLWKSRFTVERGIIWTAAFTDNGDLVLPGSGSYRIMRINHLNGDTVWTNNRIIPNTGAETMCINGNTLYAWEGGLTTPKKIIAVNVNTGITKYSSATLPGDGDQEIPFTVSKNGVVYCIRDGGLMYALKDNGSGFTELWSRGISHPVGTYTQISTGNDSSVYIPYGRKIYRLNHLTGAARDSSIDLVSSGTINPRFAIGKFGIVNVGNGASVPSDGKYFTFSPDLQTIYNQVPFSYNYYCGPTPGGFINIPHILMAGAGTEIKARYIIIDNILSESSEIPELYTLSQNYPNPFNPSTKFNYSIQKEGYGSLKIYDVHGKAVKTYFEGFKKAGEYNEEFNAGGLTSGIYFCKLTLNEISITRKMILLK